MIFKTLKGRQTNNIYFCVLNHLILDSNNSVSCRMNAALDDDVMTGHHAIKSHDDHCADLYRIHRHESGFFLFFLDWRDKINHVGIFPCVVLFQLSVLVFQSDGRRCTRRDHLCFFLKCLGRHNCLHEKRPFVPPKEGVLINPVSSPISWTSGVYIFASLPQAHVEIR